jgi:hypothetical protein
VTAKPAAPWQDRWFADSAAQQGMAAWRGVEAQHVVSTMRLVDTLAEQEELERLLEHSKPPQAPAAQARHYLLSTPFRYRPVHGSRFRKAGERGIWYGAATLRTATAEVAYWRWRFLMDSVGLAQQALHTEHTFFEAQVQGPAIDLTAAPWARSRAAWVHSSDYSATQAVAAAARQHHVQWIRYESARDSGNPAGICAAVLDVEALSAAQPLPQQTWHCKTTRQTVLLVHGSDRFSWNFH